MKLIENLFLSLGVVVILLGFGAGDATAQRVAYGYGASAFSDVYFVEPSSLPQSITQRESSTEFAIMSVSAEVKVNVIEFNTDMCISLATAPNFGLSFGNNDMDEFYFGNVKVPLWVQFDYGAISTFESMKDYGFGIGFGFEYNNLGILGEASDLYSGFMTPSVRASFRYITRNASAREIAIKYGFRTSVTGVARFEQVDQSGVQLVDQEYTADISALQISFIMYLNY